MDTSRHASGGRAAVAFAVVAVLSAWSGCGTSSDASRSADAPHEEHRSSDAAPDPEAETAPDGETPTEVEATTSAPAGYHPCPSQPWSAWATVDRTTGDYSWADLGDLVVDQDGTATLAMNEWVGGLFNARTLSVPAAEGDPQKLPGPPPNMQPVPDGSGVSATFPDGSTHLGVDDAGTLTAMFKQDIRQRRGMGSEYYDIVLSDRSTGQAWPADPHVAVTASITGAELAVNASGAAVVAWHGFEQPLRLSYRPAAGAAWTPAQPVTPDALFLADVGIDDTGRVVMVYVTLDQKVVAVRGTPVAGWSNPTPLASAGTLDVSAGGAAMVTLGRGFTPTRHYTRTMSRSGRWSDPVRQPFTRSLEPKTAIDGAGRAAYMYWNKRRLMVRWSGRDGDWRAPCVLADGVSDPLNYDDDSGYIAINDRGDAVVVYRTPGDTPQLWARYKPAGEPWTEPIDVTAEATGRQRSLRVGIGPRGHVAIAWVTPKFKQVDVIRMAPAR